ncbi:phosphoenolpyruvate synthase [Microbacterium rhizomatis]|uniref:Phosphoenolpyruvate synthase n=1 Tax=Microbacterium rhizomatis TaxID=1631477 RepID=A0A5J5J5E7_9MICO|nr:phosphoenolpyruvate synthase [Microbacterium rhizomatis]KAA9111407.1 phosphoenolpyruvate synthase [Microbacterium rhizomatis]
MSNVLRFRDIRMSDLPEVGGKNASLGEMVSQLAGRGVRVPDGFATTATAFRAFLEQDGLGARIDAAVAALDVSDVTRLATTGARVRGWIEAQGLADDLVRDIRDACEELLAREDHPDQVTWAVRSSATAEDLPDASFAGQQETFLHISGADDVVRAVKDVFASLYTDRAIVYRAEQGMSADHVAISAGVQRMVRSDIGSSGVMFTLDTETGFDGVVLVTSVYGLGETIVQGTTNPDEFYVSKPCLRAGRPAILRRKLGTKSTALRFAAMSPSGATTALEEVPASEGARFSLTDAHVEELARSALVIESHYGRPMDIEWALDGGNALLYIVQARPETVASRASSDNVVTRYRLEERGDVLARGRAVGERIGSGTVRVLSDPSKMADFRAGEVLVAERTDPDWEPIMRMASAIVTDSGGRTCHAAIIARELGIPAVVGTTTATRDLKNGESVTVACAEGDEGLVYRGALEFAIDETAIDRMPEIGVDLMLNVGAPDQAFSVARMPSAGVGLARIEFIVSREIGIHPQALLDVDSLSDPLRSAVLLRTAAYASPRDFFVRKLAEGVSTIAAAFAPRPVIVRMSDFKSNEYIDLLGGAGYEPHEENPMLGWRGAARYTTEAFAECFRMECDALRFVRDDMGFTNIKVMVPFVRTVGEATATLDLLARNGLRRGQNGLEIVMMCEIPSNALLADAFLDHFDGFSIGSNDLTQLTLGVDRESALVAGAFDERDPAVLDLIDRAIRACVRRGKYVGICGQGPSDHPDLARWLLARGIDSISLNADALITTWMRLAEPATEAENGHAGAGLLEVT